MFKKITKVLTTTSLLISLISTGVLPSVVYAEDETPITVEAPETAGTTSASEVSGTPETSETPEVAETPEVTETSETTEKPEDSETSEATETSKVSEAPEAAETAETSDESLCFVQNARIDSVKDGTAPFDKNNEIGNDTNSENNIVRSFDQTFCRASSL